jgi:hypothetical protein
MTQRWAQLLADAIDPVLAGTPFQAGQFGASPEGDAQGIWCGPHEEVITTYPHLAVSAVTGNENGCFDVVVDIDVDGRLFSVLLELVPLARAFEDMDRPDDAARAAALVGRPAEDAVPELAELLARVFVAHPS